MEIEAALLPPEIRFEKLCQLYSLRILKLPSSYPIQQRVLTSFPPFEGLGLELDWNKYADWNLTGNNIVLSQLFNLCSKLKTHFPGLNTELINHSQISPWKKDLSSLIDLQIALISKEEARKSHMDQLNNIEPSSLIIYTDGSKNEENSCLGAGIAYTTDKKDFSCNSWNLGKTSEVFDIELFAIQQAF